MELTLLGTGAPEGLPRPGCPCAVCAVSTTAAGGGSPRAATSLLVDGALLLDLTPGPAFAAARAGRSLHGVRQVLLSRAHDAPAPETPSGLPAPVRLPDGQELAFISGHRVRAVAVDAPGTGYQVIGPDGERLLYLPPGAAPAGLPGPPRPVAGALPPGPDAADPPDGLPHEARGAPRPDPVAGPHAAPATAHPPGAGLSPAAFPYDTVLLDVVARPDALARLRASGACGPETDVVAVHLDHDVPPGAELRRRVAAAGARVVPDGTTLQVGAYREPPPLPRRTLVLGGARSGKSAEAERRLAAFPGTVYVATGGRREGDSEWTARITLHRERRPASWRTLETCDLVPLLARDGPPLLVDCLSLWLTDAMDAVGAWDDARWRGGGARALADRVADLVAAVRATRRTVVAVSNEVGSGVVPATPAGRRYRDELGRLNAAFAAECEQVLLVVAGIATALRG